MKNQTLIPSVNFHLWEPCNFQCKFCFATFKDVRQTILPKGHLPKEDALRIVDTLAEAGFSKITFVGGEPTLCPARSAIEITNTLGQIVFKSQFKNEIDVSQLARGYYVLKVISPSKQILISKFIKE